MYKRIILIIIIITSTLIIDVQLISAQIDTSSQLPNLIPYRSGDKWGFCDKNKNIIIPLLYDKVGSFVNDSLIGVGLNGKYGIYNKNGMEIVPLGKYKPIYNGNDGLLPVEINGRCGFIDLEGIEVVPLVYDEVTPYSSGLAMVNLSNRLFFIDKMGNEVLNFPSKYKYPKRYVYFVEDLLEVELNGMWGFINKEGKEKIPLKYDSVKSFQNGFAKVKLNGKWGFVNKEGKEIAKPIYDKEESFSFGLAAVKKNDKWGFVNTEGKEIVQPKYDNVHSFFDGYAPVKLNGKWGFVNTKGKEIIRTKYEYANEFNNGFSAVKLNDKWGFINKEDKIIIPIIYEKVLNFHEGLASVQLNGKWGFINKENKIIIPFKYEEPAFFRNGIAALKKKGFIDKNGTEYWDDGNNGNNNQALEDAKKAFTEGKYLLVLELLKDFSIDNPQYYEAVALMNQALDKLPRNNNQTFVTVSGRINCGCSKAIAGYVVFEDINTKLSVGKCRITSNGYYCIVLPSGKKYSYYIDSKDFYPLSRVIDFTSPAQALNYKDDITLVSYEDMKEQQVSVRINNIFFDFNESNLKSESYLELDRLYKFLNENSDISVEISGHTDNIGTDEYNITLSYARANAVKDYLILKGINSSRIITKGYGKSKPVAANETDEGRQLNRRVEFKILKK